jgi:hypothetical protein
MKSFLQTIILLILTSISFAQTNYFVDNSLGTDAPGNGTSPGASAWKTIQYAIDNVIIPTSDNIIINISSGVYDLSNNQIDIDRGFTNLILIGQGIDNTIIQSAADTASSISRVMMVYSGNSVSLRKLTIRYGRFKGSTDASTGGGGILNSAGTLTIDYCKITENSGKWSEKGFGGGISNYQGSLTISNSTISHNTGATGNTGAQGGGICSYNGTLIVNNSTINDNYAPLTGGGICIISSGANSIFDMVNSTVYGNNAGSYGGIRITVFGGWSQFNAIININSSTIFNNFASDVRGGIGLSARSNFSIKNSIVAGNFSGSIPTPSNLSGVKDSAFTVTSGGFNIFQSYDNLTINDTSKDITWVDPLLLSLADNNTTNSTQTCATISGSPAINAIPGGNGAPLLDQRGAERNGNYDIGAYEWWDDSGSLPVELTLFSYRVLNDKILLNWRTETEINNYGFEIERKIENPTSLSEITWEKIGFVAGNGNSNSTKEYSFIDINPSGGNKFLYRLKQIDNDGKYEYSGVVEVEITPQEFALDENYPNPFNPNTRINYSVRFDSKVTISVYSITGELVTELVNDFRTAGKYSVNFNGNNLASGMYIYRMVADDFVKLNKMMLMK